MSLSTPQQVMERLEGLAEEIAEYANIVEGRALAWFRVKRDREKAWANAYIQANGPAHVRRVMADLAVADMGLDEEALWEGGRAKMRALESAANVGMALLKSQGRS
jgi:hypothetical protein